MNPRFPSRLQNANNRLWHCLIYSGLLLACQSGGFTRLIPLLTASPKTGADWKLSLENLRS